MYRFLLSRRWLGGFAFAVVVALGCVLLGLWQWDRREQQVERNALVTQNYDEAPVPLRSLLPDAGSALPPGSEWTPVALQGSYVPDGGLLLRNRPLDGRPGYHALVPFEVDDGTVVLVDRGWLPIGATGAGPDDVPSPPDGQVEAVVRLRPGEPPSTRDAPDGQLQSIDLAEARGQLPPALADELATGAYGVLDSEVPAPSSAPRALPRPVIDEGPHLSYSLQWFVFALGALVGFVVLVRRTAVDTEERPVVRTRPKRTTAEDEEDALLDAAERAGRVEAQPGVPPRAG